MAKGYETLKKVLNVINDKQDFNKDNIIEKIQEELERKDQDLHKEWIDEKFDINHEFTSDHPKYLKFTLSRIAAEAGYANVLDALISSGSNISDKSGKGWTPVLNLAAKHGHIGTVEALLKIEGIKIDERNEHGFTPLHNAVHKDHKEIVEVLLQAGANVDAQHLYGTPLHYAVSYCHKETVDVLLEKGANVNAVNTHGMTPLDYAKGQNVEVLLKAGGRSFVKAFNKGIATAVKTALLGTAIAAVLFAIETIAIPIAIAVVAVIAVALAVGGATYMMLKPSTKVDGVAVLMDGRQEAASTNRVT
ncbi:MULTISPECIES: ankyrin repeat domain-containing protein [unclassified Wolbachia]|uniref:ankyrin repeat domain-containing protein n=1 Tax=unclassified Wolbachia TaxID=2640676 RepID=UPI00221F4A8B|nr:MULTISPECIES: ankyrin repeat domain-containing protein [unclassified Wolbachia]